MLLQTALCAGTKLDTIELKHKVHHVNVFLQGAQIYRQASFDLLKGIYLLRLSGITPLLDESSIQLSSEGDFTLLNTFFNLKYTTEKFNSIDDVQYDQKIHFAKFIVDSLAGEIELRRGQITRLDNRPKLEDLHADGYIALSSYELDYVEKAQRTINLLRQEQDRLKDSISMWRQTILQGRKLRVTPVGELYVLVELKHPVKSNIEIAYFTGAANWYPRYDIRVGQFNEPMEIVYKAIVSQQTLEDWENTSLTISSAEPLDFRKLPKLEPWLVPGGQNRPSQRMVRNGPFTLSGVVHDESGEPLIGVAIRAEGTSLGAVSDESGRFSLTLAADIAALDFYYIGYQSCSKQIDANYLDVTMQEDAVILEEVVVTGYGGDQDFSRDVYLEKLNKIREKFSKQEMTVPVTQKREYSASVNFDVQHNYSLLSKGVAQEVEMIRYRIPVNYNYLIVPKVDLYAYLTATITGWGQYHFLEGEASIYFQQIYVGKTVFDVRFVEDSLAISLGKDQSVLVERNFIKSYSDQKWIGNQVEITHGWEIQVRNQKNEPINCTILDQYPVSKNDDWQIKLKKIERAEKNEDLGLLRWVTTIPENTTWKTLFQYEVKCPANESSKLF